MVWTKGARITSLATAGAGVDVAVISGGLAGTGFSAGGARLVWGVPIMMSDGTLDRGVLGGAGAGATGGS